MPDSDESADEDVSPETAALDEADIVLLRAHLFGSHDLKCEE